jgi:hypothetical protein
LFQPTPQVEHTFDDPFNFPLVRESPRDRLGERRVRQREDDTHFYLDVPRDVLVQRIEGRTMTPDDPERDTGVRAWCVAQIERCRATTDRLPAGTVLLDGRRPAPELAAAVLEHLGRSPSVRR